MNLHDLKRKLTTIVTIAIGFWLFTTVMSALDIMQDIRDDVPWTHIMVESTMLIACVLGAIILGVLVYKGNQLINRYLEQRLAKTELQHEALQKTYDDLLKGMAEQIKLQFMAWKLTTAEAQIGFLLIKGYSFKEIGELRATSERTVREQARSIYQKSGVTNRTELTAYFLEDLLLPQDYNDALKEPATKT